MVEGLYGDGGAMEVETASAAGTGGLEVGLLVCLLALPLRELGNPFRLKLFIGKCFAGFPWVKA